MALLAAIAVIATLVAAGVDRPADEPAQAARPQAVSTTTWPLTTTTPVVATTVPVPTTVAEAPPPSAEAAFAAAAPAPVAVPPVECQPAGDAWMDIGIGAPLRTLSFGDARLVLAGQPGSGESSEEVVDAVVSTSDGSSVALVLRSTTSDRLLLGAGSDFSWTPIAHALEIDDPAVAPSGRSLAWVGDGRLTIATATDAWAPAQVAVPVTGSRATNVGFIDEERLVLVVEEPASGASLELAARSEVWTLELASGTWTLLTSTEPEFGDWSLARSPVAAADGSILYVRQDGSNGGVHSELRQLTMIEGRDVNERVIADVPNDGLLVSAAPDGSTLWSVPRAQGGSQLTIRKPDGSTAEIGCGEGHHGSTAASLPVPGGVVLTPDVDGPDPFAVIEDGQPMVFTTNTGHGNVPVATLTPSGETIVTDALPVMPQWADAGFTWAPAVARTAGGWTLWFTARDWVSGRQCIGAARAHHPRGPYEADPEPLVCDVERGGSIDPSPVIDPDGRLVLLYKADGNCCALITTIHAVELDDTGTVTVGEPVELLRADQRWEGGVIEAPSMIFGPDGAWWLLYSAHRWASSNYVIGAARCVSPVGPCRKQAAPALDDDRHPGAGGAEFAAQTSLVLLHEWAPDGIGYESGSHRRLRLGRVEVSCGILTIHVIPRTTAADDHLCD